MFLNDKTKEKKSNKMPRWFEHYQLKNLYEIYYHDYKKTGRCELPIVSNVGFVTPLQNDEGVIRKRNECELGIGDYSNVNLSKYDMQHISFSDGIKWPTSTEHLPKNFSQRLKNGKNPGLGIKTLHKKGITGKGVRMAILDGILPEHEEYRENIKLIEDVCDRQELTQLGGCDPRHGAAITSIAVGKNCGVAPDAEVYYFPYTNYMGIKDKKTSFKNIHKIFERILELNKTNLKDNPISVICMSWKTTFKHLNKEIEGEKEMRELVKKAKNSGIFICTGSKEFDYPECDMYDHGIGRDLLKDPDDTDSVLPAYFTTQRISKHTQNRLLFPMDDRTIASPESSTSYTHCVLGGWSFVSPYVAGLYCLAKQTDPNITPQKFWQTMVNSSDKSQANELGGCIVQPISMIDCLEKQKNNQDKIVHSEAVITSVVGKKEKSMNKTLQKAQEDGKNMIQNDKRTITKKGVLLSKQVQH